MLIPGLIVVYIVIGFYLAILWTLYWHEKACVGPGLFGQPKKNPADTSIDPEWYIAGAGMGLFWPLSLIASGVYLLMQSIIRRRYRSAATLAALNNIGKENDASS